MQRVNTRTLLITTFLFGALSHSPVWASDDVHAAGSDPVSATPVQREQAQSRFLKGKELFDQGSYEQALAEFEASRAIVASPNARLYRARCLKALGRTIEAYNEFGSTMVEALELGKLEPRYNRTAEASGKERQQLEAQLAFVRLTILNPPAGTVVRVNGETIRRTAWSEPVPAMQGVVVVELEAPADPAPVVERRELKLSAGQTEDVEFELKPPPTPPAAKPTAVTPRRASLPPATHQSMQPYAFAAAGVGAVGMGAFTVFGLMSNDTLNDLEQACPDDRCPVDEEQRIDDGKNQQLLANIGLAVGIIGFSGAVTLFVLDGDAEDEHDGVRVGVTLDRIIVQGQL